MAGHLKNSAGARISQILKSLRNAGFRSRRRLQRPMTKPTTIEMNNYDR